MLTPTQARDWALAFRQNVGREPRLDFLEWGERYLDNADGSKFHFLAYQRDVARAMFAPKVRQVSLRWSSGAGKTYLLGAGFLFGVHQLREEMAIMLPNTQDAEDWLRSEFSPMHDKTGAVAAIGYKTDGGDLVRKKEWNNGAKLVATGASFARIRRLQAGVLYADEIDALTSHEGSGDEGDFLAAFMMRGRRRKRVQRWVSSYPSLKGQSRIDTQIAESHLYRWAAACPECGHRWPMSVGDLVETADPADASLKCPGCKRLLDDAQRRAMSEAGRWEDKAGRGVELEGSLGFHLDAMGQLGPYDDAFSSFLHYVAHLKKEAETSENPKKTLRVFANTVCAKSYEPPFEEKPEATAIVDRREDYDPAAEVPAGVLVIVVGADVQKDRIELEYVGYGANRETWGLGYKVLRGSPLRPEVWKALDAARKVKFDHPSGKKLGVSCMAVDSGHQPTAVMRYTRSRRGVFAVRGSPVLEAPVVSRLPSGRLAKPTQPQVGSQEAKDIIRQRLALEPSPDGSFPAGYMHFPATEEYLDTYFDQLLSEQGEAVIGKDGNVHIRYTCPDGARNEVLDIRVYALWAYLAPRFNLREVKSKIWGDKREREAVQSGGGGNFATDF